jgi:mannose-6-phosphate isomerase-like protein (cupin superfamily)
MPTGPRWQTPGLPTDEEEPQWATCCTWPTWPETTISSGRWQPLNERLGITNFGISAVVVEPGEDPDIEHDEGDSGHQEVYVVVSGRAAFQFGDEHVEAGPGDVVALPDPHETRGYQALEPGTRIICLGAGPGAVHPYGRWIAEEAAREAG